jgi:hypothetical protein
VSSAGDTPFNAYKEHEHEQQQQQQYGVDMRQQHQHPDACHPGPYFGFAPMVIPTPSDPTRPTCQNTVLSSTSASSIPPAGLAIGAYPHPHPHPEHDVPLKLQPTVRVREGAGGACVCGEEGDECERGEYRGGEGAGGGCAILGGTGTVGSPTFEGRSRRSELVPRPSTETFPNPTHSLIAQTSSHV